MRVLFLIVCSFLMASCGDEKVLLPQVIAPPVHDVTDHSPIYFFYRLEDNDTLIEVNKNNLISTTNWVFNIDKRLPLKVVVPELVTFLNKKRGAAMHKNEEAQLYFSCSDSIQKQLAFFPFTQVTYAEQLYHSVLYIKSYPDYHVSQYPVSISFLKSGNVIVDGNEMPLSELKGFIQEFIVFASDKKPILLYLNFDQDISYDRYLKSQSIVRELVSDQIQISTSEFIYDRKKVKLDCDCKI